MCLMNDPRVIKEIARILCPGGWNQQQLFALQAQQPPQPQPASEKEVKDFLRWVWSQRRRKAWPPLDRKVSREFLPREFRERFDAIVRRLFRDLVRGHVVQPAKKGGEPKGGKPQGKKRPRKPSKKR